MNSNTSPRGKAARLGTALAAGLLVLAASAPASARGGERHGYHDGPRTVVIERHGPRGHGRHHHRHRHHHRGPDVVYVYPREPYVVTREVVVERPVIVERRVIEEHQPQSYGGHSGYYDSNASRLNAGSLIGAAIGGLLGSQVGGGSGKLAATAAGTVGGFLIGNHANGRR